MPDSDADLPGIVDALGQLEHEIQFLRIDAIRGLLSSETKVRLLHSLKTKLQVDLMFLKWLDREIDMK